MDQVEKINCLLAESFNCTYKQEPCSSQDVVEILMEDIQSDDDLSEESGEPEEEEKIETHCVYKETILKEKTDQIDCTMGQGGSTTLIKMESDSDCEAIATWEENDTADRRIASSDIIVPETKPQDDLMLSYHKSYPPNIINQGDLPTTVLEDKIKEAENPSGALSFPLLHHANVSVNLRNQGNTNTCKNKETEMVTVQIKEKSSNDTTISNDTENNKTSSCIESKDREKSMLFLLLTSHQEKHKNMKNCSNQKRNFKTCVNGHQKSSSNSPQKDQEIHKNPNFMDPIFMHRKQSKNSSHKSKGKQGKNVLKTPLEVFEPIGTNNRKQRDIFEKNRTINRPQGVDVTHIPGNFMVGNSMQKNKSATLFPRTEIAAPSSENLEVFEPIGTNTSKQRDIFEKNRTITRSQGVDVTHIQRNFVLGNSMQENKSINHATLFHRAEIAVPTSENLEVFEPIGTNNSKQRYVFEKKRTIDSLTHGVVDLTQIPENFPLENMKKNESNNLSHKKVDAETWKNLSKMFQDAGSIKNKNRQIGCKVGLKNCKKENKRQSKKKTTIRRRYTSKHNGEQIHQENQKITVPVGVHSKQNKKNFQNINRKPEDVFETTGLDISKKIDVSEKERNNKQMQRVNVTEHFVLRNSMQENGSSNCSILLDPKKNVSLPWINLSKTHQTDGSNVENLHTNNQLDIGHENQQAVDPVLIHNTQNDLHFNNSKRKQVNMQLGMFEYINIDTEQGDVPKKEAAVNKQTQLLHVTQKKQSYALENDFYHNERNNHTNLLEPNEDVDPLGNLAEDLLQNTESTILNKYDQNQTNNMLKSNTNIMQNQISSNGTSLLFSLLNNGRNQPTKCQEPQGYQRNEVILNNSKKTQGKEVALKKAPLKILENVCIAKARSHYRDISQKEIITNKHTEGEGSSVTQLNENFALRNVVDTSREYLETVFDNPRRTRNKQVLLQLNTKSSMEQPNNMLAHQLCERAESVLNEAKLPEVIHGQPLIHNRISPQLLGQNNQKTDNETVRKVATSSKRTERIEIHQMQTSHQSLTNESRQQMNLNINPGKEVLVWDNGTDSYKNKAAPKKTDNLTPVAAGKYNQGKVNEANNIQGKLVPVLTNQGLIYCVVIPKNIKLGQENKDGPNPWVEQINYRTRKRNVEQCVLISSSEDEGGEDPMESKKKRKLAKNSISMVKNVNFSGCSNNEQNNVVEKISHEGKQSKDIAKENRNIDNGKENRQQNKHHRDEQENELGEENGDSISRDNIYEDPFDCSSSSSDGDILEDSSDIEFSNEDEESGVKEVPKSTKLLKF